MLSVAACCCGSQVCSTFYCPACGEFLAITQGTVTDDLGTHAFDSTGTTGRISWTTPNGYNGFDDTPTTIITQYYYSFVCQDVAGIHKVILTIHFWTIDVNGDGSVILYDAPDIPGEEDGASSAVIPSGCDPLTSSHTFIYNVALPPEPTATATVSILKAGGQTCVPCCIPGDADGPLTITLSGGSVGDGTYTMTLGSGSPTFAGHLWRVEFSPSFGLTYVISFGCLPSGNLAVKTVSTSLGSVDCVLTNIADFSCDPLHVHFQASASTPVDCPACSDAFVFDLGKVTDDTGTHALDATGTTGRISWTTPNGYNGVNDTPSTITTQYYYSLTCDGSGNVVLVQNFWTIDVNGDGTVILYDAPDTVGEENSMSSTVTPSGCDPLMSSHSFSSALSLPSTTARVSIPRSTGATCFSLLFTDFIIDGL